MSVCLLQANNSLWLVQQLVMLPDVLDQQVLGLEQGRGDRLPKRRRLLFEGHGLHAAHAYNQSSAACTCSAQKKEREKNRHTGTWAPAVAAWAKARRDPCCRESIEPATNATKSCRQAAAVHLQDASTLDVLCGLLHAVLDVETIQLLILHSHDRRPVGNTNAHCTAMLCDHTMRAATTKRTTVIRVGHQMRRACSRPAVSG